MHFMHTDGVKRPTHIPDGYDDVVEELQGKPL